jgi:hypothetical protein
VQSQELSMLSGIFSSPGGAGGLTPFQRIVRRAHEFADFAADEPNKEWKISVRFVP